MLDEGLHFRRHEARARVDDVNGRRRRAPLAKNAFESTGAQIFQTTKRGKKRNADAGDRTRVKNVEVGYDHARRRGDLHRLCAPREAPARAVAPPAAEPAAALLSIL